MILHLVSLPSSFTEAIDEKYNTICNNAGGGHRTDLWHKSWVHGRVSVFLVTSNKAEAALVHVAREQRNSDVPGGGKGCEVMQQEALLLAVARGAPVVQNVVQQLGLPKIIHQLVVKTCKQ
jgi:hypothetical protein